MEFDDFPFSWECHDPSWLYHIFQRGRLNHQPDYYSRSSRLFARKIPMNHQKVSLNHHYHKTPLKHHESLHYSHVFVMKKNTKMSEAEEGPDRRFPFGLFPRSWENHPFLMGFPSFPPFPPFPVVPRGSPVVPRFCRSGSFYQRLPANAGLLPCREDEAR